MKIGIMGGTFDPVHCGHIALAEYSYRDHHLDSVWFMPNRMPPHKEFSSIRSKASDRVHMVSLAIEPYPYFRLETYEAFHEHVSYTFETLTHFNKTYPEDEFYYIVGADSLYQIETWKNPAEIFANCIMLAALRDDIDMEEKLAEQMAHLEKKYHADIRFLNCPLLPYSSTDIRNKIHHGEDISNEVPQSVADYIKERGLYE